MIQTVIADAIAVDQPEGCLDDAAVEITIDELRDIWGVSGQKLHDNANMDDANPETMHKRIADMVSSEAALKLIPHWLAELHESGSLHIHDLDAFVTKPFCFSSDLRYILYYGLMPDGVGNRLPVAGPAKNPEVAVLHAAKALGCSQTCFSVAFDEKVLIEEHGETKVIEIGPLVDTLIAKKYDAVYNRGGVKCLDLDGEIKAYSFNRDTKIVSAKPVYSVMRHFWDGPMYNIRTFSGRRVSVTGAHSLFVLKNGQVIPIKVSDLKIGDYLAVPVSLPTTNETTTIDIFKELLKLDDELISDVYVSNLEGDLPFNRKGSIPLLYIKQKGLQVEHSKAVLYIARSKHVLPALLPVTEEFVRLLGYYAAEGNIYRDNIVLSFGTERKQIALNDAIRCIDVVAGAQPTITNPGPSATQVRFRNALLKRLMLHVFKVGNGAKEKHVPTIIYNISNELKKQYIGVNPSEWTTS